MEIAAALLVGYIAGVLTVFKLAKPCLWDCYPGKGWREYSKLLWKRWKS